LGILTKERKFRKEKRKEFASLTTFTDIYGSAVNRCEKKLFVNFDTLVA
jgi:hypothetical protein